jgi:hypothetical protein
VLGNRAYRVGETPEGAGGKQVTIDMNGKELLVDYHLYQVGGGSLNVPVSLLESRRPAQGGVLAKYLLPRTVAMEKEINPGVKGSQAWAWGPPPLVGEGEKVEAEWLYGFLLNPHPIRPAAVLRMPRFNMSTGEATALVNYFAAIDNADYPYDYDQRRQEEHLAEAQRRFAEKLGPAAQPPAGEADPPLESEQLTRLDAAMNIVTSGDYCVKCHLVGDFEPKGRPIEKAPDLSVVYRRLRPDYARRWIARPPSIQPYTSMPVNVPYDAAAPHLGGVSQKLYPGTSVEQLDALVDLLMNYDEFARSQQDVSSRVQPATMPAAEEAGGGGG